MILIWGSRICKTDISSGRFYCPQCKAPSSYIRKKVSRRFTIYFIPLWQIDDLGEIVECQTCGQGFRTEILDYQAIRALAIRKYIEIAIGYREE